MIGLYGPWKTLEGSFIGSRIGESSGSTANCLKGDFFSFLNLLSLLKSKS